MNKEIPWLQSDDQQERLKSIGSELISIWNRSRDDLLVRGIAGLMMPAVGLYYVATQSYAKRHPEINPPTEVLASYANSDI